MKRILLSLLLAFAFAGCGAASPESIHLSAVSPAEGEPGTKVVASGKGFGAKTGTVLVGASPVTPESWTPQRVVFYVPNVSAGTTTIRLQTAQEKSNALAFEILEGNQAPVLASASLGNGPFDAAHDLTVVLGEASDADGDPVSFTYAWKINGADYPQAAKETLPRSSFQRGDTVQCTVTPFDGNGSGQPVSTEAVTIENAPPQEPALLFDMLTFSAGNTISVSPILVDADGDPVSATYQWYVNGAAVTGATSSSLPQGNYMRGDVVTVRITVTDGAASTVVTSDPLLVGNAAPAVSSVDFGAIPPTRAAAITASPNGSDIDGDSLTYLYEWRVNGSVVVGQTGATLAPAFFAKGDTVEVRVTVDDGMGGEATFLAPVLTVANAVPTLAGATIGTGPYYTNVTISAYPTGAFDADGDTITYSYRWFVDDAEVAGQDGSSLSGLYFDKDQTVHAALTPSDGTAYGTSVVSNQLTIVNARPTSPAVVIRPDGFSAQTPRMWVEITTASSDPDGDAVTYLYRWNRDGVDLPYSSSQTMITNAAYGAGDLIRLTVTASDGVASTPVETTRYVVPAIAAGRKHSCAVVAGGGVKCWGDNSFGQLGNGDTGTDQHSPVDVSGLASGVQEVVAGHDHTCALLNSGGVKCWGVNAYGQLGNGNTSSQSTPVEVSGLSSGVIALAAGRAHTCALLVNDGVKCWGNNDYGQLGTLTASQLTPTSIFAGSAFVNPKAIAAGQDHTCMITSIGGVACWGRNSEGQIGTGDQTDQVYATIIIYDGVNAVAAGYEHTCALLTSGGVQCWGANTDGQLGKGDTERALLPVGVTDLTSGVQGVSAGYRHTCALMESGGVKCWGDNALGQLGNTNTTDQWTPANAVLTSGVEDIALGRDHSCVFMDTGGAKCWGFNADGQLGNGETWSSSSPVNVVGTP